MRLTGKDLNDWAGQIQARSDLPELVRRLIHATIEPEQLERVDIPADEGIAKRGVDGLVIARVGKSGFVPQGCSVWEMGCGKDFERKANLDYDARVKHPPAGIDPKQTTFVFVTPHRWPGRAKWELERRAEGHWQEVLVLDADNLVDRLQHQPGVAAWFAELIGRPGPLQDLELRWGEWSRATLPFTTEALVLAGRDDARDELLAWLDSIRSSSRMPQPLTVVGADADEAMAFCWAGLSRMPSELGDYWRARALVVSNDESLRRLALEPGPLLIVARDCSYKVAVAVAIQGHAVLLTYDARVPDDALLLPPLDVRRAQVELEYMGLTTEDAYALIRKARGALPGGPGVSLAALRRELGARDVELPTELAPLLLAGAWTDDERDVALMCEILGAGSERLRQLEREFSGDPGSPLVRVRDAWRISSRRVLWRLGRFVPEDFDRFERVLLHVFASREASVCSDELARGLLEGLVLLAIESDQRRAEQIVSRVLHAAPDFEHWTRDANALRSFVEAAPREFINWATDIIEPNGPSSSWAWKDALEVLAWSGAHLADAVTLLAGLVDPEQGAGDEALQSLCEIFRPWYPQTSASEDDRLVAFEALDHTHPRVAFELLWELLPSGTSAHAHGTARPNYREWANGASEALPWEDLGGHYVSMCERLLAMAGEQPHLWLRILPDLNKLHPQHRATLVEQLVKIDVGAFTPEQREALRSQLRDFIHTTRKYEHNWPPELLNQLVQLHDRLAPPDLRDALTWLFTIAPRILQPTPFDEDTDSDPTFADAAQAQLEAAHLLNAQFGATELVKYSHHVRHPSALGSALARACPQRALELVEASTAASPGASPGFLQGVGAALFSIEGVDILRHDRFANLPASQLAELALAFPHAPQTWDLIESLGPEVSRLYWQQTGAFLPDDRKALERVVRALLSVNRPWAAAGLAALKYELPARLIVELIDRLTDGPAGDQADDPQFGNYLLGRLLARLRVAPNFDEVELQRLEWKLLLVLDKRREGRPTALHDKLANDPAYFVEIVHLSLGAARDDATKRARELLLHWRGLPGRVTDEMLDGERLLTWVMSARAGLRALGLGSQGDEQLGEVLARSPVGADGRWPHEAVRDIIESFGRCPDLHAGVYSGRRYRREARIVDPQRDLRQADRLHADAKFMRTRWPRTAHIIEQLARASEQDAEFWQDHVGRERDDWTPAATTSDRLEAFLDKVVASGRYVFDFEEAAQAIGDPPELRSLLSTSPTVAAISDDAYVIVEREYRSIGAPPPSWYLDELVRRAGLRYCVALLSAAELHGAADQHPQVFQVLVDRPHERITVGGQPIQFITRPREQAFLATPTKTHTGTMLVATPEATVFDLVEFEHACGGRDHVVVVLEELVEAIDPTALIDTARAYPPAVVETAAERLEQTGHSALAHSLRDAVERLAVGA